MARALPPSAFCETCFSKICVVLFLLLGDGEISAFQRFKRGSEPKEVKPANVLSIKATSKHAILGLHTRHWLKDRAHKTDHLIFCDAIDANLARRSVTFDWSKPVLIYGIVIDKGYQRCWISEDRYNWGFVLGADCSFNVSANVTVFQGQSVIIVGGEDHHLLGIQRVDHCGDCGHIFYLF